MKKTLFLLTVIFTFSCKEEVLPKPKAFLRLDYPSPVYKTIEGSLPFTFKKNTLSRENLEIKKRTDSSSIGVDIIYPSLKATIYLTYKRITKNKLESHLKDAQNITQKHTQKADEIIEQPFVNASARVYGMFYEVGGNAASQSQFYATDSISHFLTGSLYFNLKPNFDSIFPASEYLKNDIKHIMETLKWKD